MRFYSIVRILSKLYYQQHSRWVIAARQRCHDDIEIYLVHLSYALWTLHRYRILSTGNLLCGNSSPRLACHRFLYKWWSWTHLSSANSNSNLITAYRLTFHPYTVSVLRSCGQYFAVQHLGAMQWTWTSCFAQLNPPKCSPNIFLAKFSDYAL